MMGKFCPYIKKDCKEDCVFFRSGLRYFDNEKKPVAFKECAINVIADCLENLVTRSIGQQKASEETRNELASMNSLFLTLAQDRLHKLGTE